MIAHSGESPDNKNGGGSDDKGGDDSNTDVPVEIHNREFITNVFETDSLAQNASDLSKAQFQYLWDNKIVGGPVYEPFYLINDGNDPENTTAGEFTIQMVESRLKNELEGSVCEIRNVTGHHTFPNVMGIMG